MTPETPRLHQRLFTACVSLCLAVMTGLLFLALPALTAQADL